MIGSSRKLVCGLLGSVAISAGAVAAPALQPFVIDHEHRVSSAVDVNFLLDRTAGEHGFIRTANGHLVNGEGQRFRCWGVDLAGWTPGSALLPDKASAEVYAASLARLGVNCVRLHFLDMPDRSREAAGEGNASDQDTEQPMASTPAGLIDSSRSDTKAFNPDQLDRLDYLVYQLKTHGVYVDLNLNVGRSYKEGDGVPDYDRIWVAKGYTYFGPELIERQKEYARTLLTHVNPYTKTAYNNEPAVALVEIVNENSLTEFWMRNWLRGDLKPGAPRLQLDLTPHYKELLTSQYNAWLTTTRTAKDLERLRRLAHVQAGQPIPLLRRGEFNSAPKERFSTELAFYVHVESTYFKDMHRFLKSDLEVKVPIIGTNDHTFQISGFPLLRSTSQFPVLDAHAYWQHPAIYGRRATPMVDDPLHSIVVKLARTAMAGKPFTLSEINEPFPNDYGGELIPILASYAAFQDWDAVFFYAMEPKLIGQWKGVIGDYFDIAQDPVRIGQLPLGALIFLRGDVQAARQVVKRTYSKDQIDQSARQPASERPYYVPDFPLSLPLVHGSRIECLDCTPMRPLKAPTGNTLVSDTGQLQWYAEGEHTGLVTAKTEHTEVLTGFIGKAQQRNSGQTPHLSPDIQNDFATLGLSSLDGKPIAISDRMLLVATGSASNTGAAWDSRHAMLKKWGTAPTVIEPITGWIQLKDLDGAVQVTVTPYDGAGRPLTPVKARMLEGGWEFPIGTPAATNYLIQIDR